MRFKHAMGRAAAEAGHARMRRLLILVCAALAGCATYQPKPLTPERLAQHFDARALSDPELRTFIARETGHNPPAWPLQRWNLETLSLAAEYYNPALVLSRAQLQAAAADVSVAGTRPNPSLQLPFEYTANHEGAGRPYTAGAVFDIPIETAHKRDHRIEQASHLYDAAALDIHNQTWLLRSRIRTVLLNWYAAQRRSALLQRQVDAQDELLRMLGRRAAVGEAAVPDTLPVSLALIDAQTALAAAQNAMNTLRGDLAGLIGVPVSALNAVELDVHEFDRTSVPLPSAEAQRAALFKRSDLRAALARYEASQSALQLEVAKQYPDIHIGPGYIYDLGARKLSFGLASMTLPIFNQNQGGIAQAEARRAEAAARATALQDTLINGLEQAQTRYRASGAAERQVAARRSIARQTVDREQARFNAGETDRLALTRARVTYQASALANLDAHVASQQAIGALEDAMHIPLPGAALASPVQTEGVSP